MRVHELAKKMGLSSKDILSKLRELSIETGNHMSKLDDATIELIQSELKTDTDKTAIAEPLVKQDTNKKQEKAPEPAAVEKTPHPTPKTVPQKEMPSTPPVNNEEKTITIKGSIIVKNLAEAMNERPNKLIAELMRMNILASINERLELNVAKKIAENHGFNLIHEKKTPDHTQVSKKNAFTDIEEEVDKPEDMQPRSPVVTFLGHVDHGKTSVLDKIRKTSVVSGESGGITQHIGAYTVDINGSNITFLDTPGHAAFTAMRARGANLTDIAVIIIAADDGIMPQTKEAIKHALAANVSFMVAINKIDLPGANIDRVKQQLQAEGLTSEDWGGDVITVEVSAHTGEGIDHLLEMILLQADMLELRANPKRRGQGFVIEAKLEQGMGPTANILVTNGTLKVGDPILCGQYYGKVKALINDHGVKVKQAGPSTPVKCLGLSGVPEAGSEFHAHANDKTTKYLANMAELKAKEEVETSSKKISLDNIFNQLAENEKLELNVILKGDVQGSIEAITHSLREIKSDKVSLNIILSATGNITVNDIMLASASNAVVLGFHISKEPGVNPTAKQEGVEVRLHQVIYELLDQVTEAMTGLLAPELKETSMGQAEIKQLFELGKNNSVAGCYVSKGRVSPKFRARVKRDKEIIFEGTVDSLRHFQDTVTEVKEGQECGIRLSNFSKFDIGDIIEFYKIDEHKQSL